MQEQVTGERPVAGDTADYGLFRGQPHGLITVAGFEMWERFSFYGIQVILAYYIYYSVTDGGLGWSTTTAVAIVGAYGGAVYIVQPIGTWLADRVLGVRYMVLAGGIIIMSGHITLGLVPGAPGLFVGLALIVVGTGAMMANVTAMVGTLYRHGETGRRDAGYSLFYMGIMAGAFLGPIFTGLQTVYGFHVAFFAAAVGMACGIVWYVAGWKRGRLPDSSRSVPNPLSSQGRMRMALGSLVFVVSIGALCAFGVINVENINNIIFGALIVASIGILAFIYRSGNITQAEQKGVLRYVPIYIAAVLFWGFNLQAFTTLAVYMDTRVNLQLGGWKIPPSYLIALYIGAGIIFVPIMTAVWKKFSRPPSDAVKAATGLVVMGISYLIFALLSGGGPDEAKVGLPLVVLAMVLFGLAEITTAPVLYSMTSEHAPSAFSSQMMGFYTLTFGLGASLSGTFGGFYSASHELVFFGLNTLGCLLTAGLFLLTGRSKPALAAEV